jgi:hypothetical protein
VLAELRDRHNRGERHLHADHDVPIAERSDLRLDLDNLRTRCDACHRGKTLRETRGPGRPVEDLGVCVTGPTRYSAREGASFQVFPGSQSLGYVSNPLSEGSDEMPAVTGPRQELDCCEHGLVRNRNAVKTMSELHVSSCHGIPGCAEQGKSAVRTPLFGVSEARLGGAGSGNAAD